MAFLFIVRIMLLVALLKLLLETERPFLCAGIYTAILFVLTLALEMPFTSALGWSGIRFGIAALYFWLLDRFQGSPLVFFPILVVGLGFALI